jgi:molybdopterin/thiamine biosynthesis adenylyltransferase
VKKITVVGAGALGSHVVLYLRNQEASLRVIDFDRVEMKNTMSQFHGRPSVGKLKTESLAKGMQFFFGLKVEVVPTKLVANNTKELLGKADLLIDCLDNGEARRLVQGFARENKVACLHGALSADGTFGKAEWDETFAIDDAASAGAATCENGEHLPFIGITAAYVAQAAQEFVRNGKKIGFAVSTGGAIRI